MKKVWELGNCTYKHSKIKAFTVPRTWELAGTAGSARRIKMLIDIPSKGFLNFDNVSEINFKRYSGGEGAVIAYTTGSRGITIYVGARERCYEEIMRIHDAYLNGDDRVVIQEEKSCELETE